MICSIVVVADRGTLGRSWVDSGDCVCVVLLFSYLQHFLYLRVEPHGQGELGCGNDPRMGRCWGAACFLQREFPLLSVLW